MPENLIELVSPQLSKPVTRKPADAATISEDGADQSIVTIGDFPLGFAADDE